MKKTGEFYCTVYYADTDAYGVVWHGAYLRWLEAGRTEFLREIGLDLKTLQDEKGIVLPVAALDLKYVKPARYGDKISVLTKLVELKNVSATFTQEIVSQENPDIIYLRAKLKCGGVYGDGRLVKNMADILCISSKC